MKIKSIKLHPFAGTQSREFDFSGGLNLMLGPNEAGKSTLCHAIRHGILTTTSLTTRQFKDIMKRFLPVGGGDVIRVTLKLYEEDPEAFYEIKKNWRPGLRNGEAKLIKPGGTEITDEEKVQELIEAVCPVTPSTFREVMLSRQSELHRLMDRMKKQNSVQQELSDVLRQSVMEAGGMSVDRFREKVAGEYKSYFEHWDREKQYPQTDASERDRGVANPWNRGVGRVLETWYEKEQARAKYEEIVEYEEQLDAGNRRLEQLNRELEEKEKKYNALAPIKDQLQQREMLENRLMTVGDRFERIKKIAEQWPVYEFQVKSLAPELEALNEKLGKLNGEQEKASQKAEIEALKERLVKLGKYKERIQQAREDLKDSKAIEAGDTEELRTLKGEIDNLRTTIRASKLKVSLTARNETEVALRDVEGEASAHILSPGEEKTFEQEGVVTLETDDLEVTVQSATGNLDEVLAGLEEKQEALAELLEELEVEDLQDAVSQHQLHQSYRRELNQAIRQFKEELGSDDYEQLQEQLEAAGNVEEVRSLGEIQEEIRRVMDERGEKQNTLNNLQAKLDEWNEEFDGEKDRVFEKRAELTGEKKEIEGKLEELPDLPEEFHSFADFSAQVDALDQAIDRLNELRGGVREELAQLSGGAPEESSAEYKERLDDLVLKFERVNRKAESIARVHEETGRILDGLEDETYQPLVHSFTQWLEEMSNGRFTDVQQERELPEAIVTEGNEALPFDILSHGTKDMTALAWKLTATEYFLNDTSSFILLDDPLVDMDPGRRKLAAQAIQKIAEDHQVLICTCHPEYEELMEGKVIKV